MDEADGGEGFGGDEASGAHERLRIGSYGHQADVCQLRNTVNEDDIRRFDVAMHQSVLMQFRKGLG